MKLLDKSIRSYLIYAAIVLLIAIPVFYFAIQRIIKEDVDESLMAHKEQIVSKLEGVIDSNPFSFLEAFEPNLTITAAKVSAPYDKFYTIEEYDKVSEENIPYRVLESNLLIKNTPYTVKLKSSLLDSKDLIQSIVIVMAVLLLLIITGLIIINRGISKKIWKPFYSTLDKLHHYRVDKTETMVFDKTAIDEFADLNNTITSLSQRNQKVYLSQKEFTENASHEMQTPLAIFQNKLELLMQTNPLSPEQAGLMEELANANQRMNRLNKSLLLLTKIENNQFLDKEPVSLKGLLDKLIEQYKFQADKKNLIVKAQYEEDISIEANKSLTEILLSNLLSNAIRHNIPGGHISITCKKHQLVIENTAKGHSLDTTKLFQRFQKQSTDAGSIGLGLEIAKKITDLYQFTIEYQFADNSHRFLIHF
jgi:signal transduction histidine kinase